MKKIFVILLILVVFNISNFCFLENDKSFENNYYKRAKHILGYDIDLSNLDKQYPPLFVFLTVPAIFLNIDLQIYYMLLYIIFSFLTIFILFLLSLKENQKNYIIILMLIICFNMLFTYNGFLYMGAITMFSTMLATAFLYFFIDTDKKINIYISGFIFCLLIATQFIFFYMIPFILLWLFFKSTYFIKSCFKFFSISFFGFLLIMINRILNYGFSLKEILAGYYSYIFYKPFGIYPENILNKIFSIILDINVFVVILYYIIFILILYLVYKYVKNYDRNKFLFYKLLVLNFFIFLIPCFAWGVNYPYLIYRYIIYFTPFCMYVSFSYLENNFKR